MTTTPLPRAAPARVLALGAWLKHTACLLDGAAVHWSPLHGDLATPEAVSAMAASAQRLLAAAGGRVDAVAHDLHPDFPSTRLAQALAQELGVPAIGVQHHHAHAAVVLAESGLETPVIALALDGVGLGTDGSAWGGELLWVHGARWRRLGHLGRLALPGGDVAAREPWRMAAALLHALGRADEIEPRLAPAVGARLAGGVRDMLARGLNCPPTSSAGRWFDAAAGLLGLSVRQAAEAEAAVALERAATDWLAGHETRGAPAAPAAPGSDASPQPSEVASTGLDLQALGQALCRAPDAGTGAAWFHLGLARALADAAAAAARAQAVHTVVLGGGCLMNRLLSRLLAERLQAAGLTVRRPQALPCGDAGLALGQAWVAAHALADDRPPASPAATVEVHAACA
jgi:hydrogenase maturation protein HypF